MPLSYEKQRLILHDAARACGMDGHTSENTGTAAERAMVMFGGNRKQPRKNSYLYLDSVDACFYIQGDTACCTFSAKWYANSADLDKSTQTSELIKTMLAEMQSRIDEMMGGEK